jgi:hypothetical protein
MIPLKFLYKFKAIETIEKEQIEESKNDQGEVVKTIKTVKEENPVEFAVRKPNRVLFDDAELFYGVKLAEAIKAGMLTKTLMIKKYEKDGGIFTENELERIKNILESLGETQAKLDILDPKEETKELSEEEKKEKENLEAMLKSLRLELMEVENNKNNIFEQTAENRAKNKMLMWWILQLCYKKEGEIYSPLFGEGSYEQRIAKYDELEEGDDKFLKKVLTKFAYFVSFWYAGKANTEEEFKNVEDFVDKENES